MSDHLSALKKAIYAALNGTISCAVYDDVPQGSSYPYVVIDNVQASTEEPVNGKRDRCFVYLSVWSRYNGQKQVLEILGELEATLNRTRPALDSGAVVLLRVTRKGTSREPDDETYMGHATVEGLVEY